MRDVASVLHLDLDAFFAAVEQRDKPSLRGKPVIVGGLGPRGVVSTASYEARVFGVRSAMPMHEARRRCPRAAFLSGRFGAYHVASRIVMGLLRDVSPVIEPLSLDEAFVDLSRAAVDVTDERALLRLGETLRADVSRETGGLTASVGLGSSKFMAKLASELAKPDGIHLVSPGSEADVVEPLPVGAIPGVGPVTREKLERLGIRTVADLRSASEGELRREIGQAWAAELSRFAIGEDDRPVSPDRDSKSISIEDTFDTDVADMVMLERQVTADAAAVATRLAKTGMFARTVTVKLKTADFATHTRSRTLAGAVDSAEVIADAARSLLRGSEAIVRTGVRLIGVGVSGFTSAAQEALFDVGAAEPDQATRVVTDHVATLRSPRVDYRPGNDVVHDEMGPGWVWGSGLGRVTVRFETATSARPGPVRSYFVDDPQLRPAPVVADEDEES